ncbi:MAG: hypothetical protein WA993_12275 [Candidatus Binatus sp.]|jgi:hypothetical protein|uniref:hypothetical protein n=1 Tax=Candidatus Binatus sp. TaxID=2811406 RepID=UPI003C89D7C3
MPRKKSPRATPAWMRRLTALAVAVGVIATLSYGTGAHIAVRYLNPSLGAWWNSSEFAIVECAAAAVGMLIGIRFGARLVNGGALRNRSMIAAVIVCALVLPIVARVGAEIARLRFTSGASANAWLIDHFGYDVGMFLDKLLTAGVYSIKIAAFALPAGMVLFGAAIAIFMTAKPVGDTAAAISR